MLAKTIKWASLPVLLAAAPFSGYAPRYELLLNLAICMGAAILTQLAVRSRDYFWAAGLVAIAVLFSPLILVAKIFLLMGFTCVAAVVTLFSAFRRQPVLAWHSDAK